MFNYIVALKPMVDLPSIECLTRKQVTVVYLCHSQRVYCIYRCRLLTQRRETRWFGTINDNIVSYDKTSVNNICLFRVSSIKVSLRCCLLTQLVIRIQPRCFLKPLSESGIRQRYFWIFILLSSWQVYFFISTTSSTEFPLTRLRIPYFTILNTSPSTGNLLKLE